MYDESLEIIRRVLSDGKVTFAGKHYTLTDVGIEMRPLQTPHPPFWYGIGSPGGIEKFVRADFTVDALDGRSGVGSSSSSSSSSSSRRAAAAGVEEESRKKVTR